jgi:hypothetical protein
MKWIDWLALWVLLFGIYPLAHPDHHDGSLMAWLDIALHIGAATVLMSRWKIARRVH